MTEELITTVAEPFTLAAQIRTPRGREALCLTVPNPVRAFSVGKLSFRSPRSRRNLEGAMLELLEVLAAEGLDSSGQLWAFVTRSVRELPE